MSGDITHETMHEQLVDIWEAAALSGVAAVQAPAGTVWLPTSEDGRDGRYLIYSVTKAFIALTYLRYVDRNLGSSAADPKRPPPSRCSAPKSGSTWYP